MRAAICRVLCAEIMWTVGGSENSEKVINCKNLLLVATIEKLGAFVRLNTFDYSIIYVLISRKNINFLLSAGVVHK